MLGLAYLMLDCWLEVSLYPERSCDRPTRSGFSVVSLGPRANAELEPKFHVVLHASRAALPMVILKVSPNTNTKVTLTLGWITLFIGDMCEGT
jgi:hypothetical protein